MKSKLILPMILLNILSGAGSAIMIYVSGGNPIWIAALLTTLPLPFLLMVATNVLGITRTSARLPIIQLLSLGGLALVIYLLYTHQSQQTISDLIALGIVIFGVLSVQWYIWVFSPYGREKSRAIVNGQPLPELHLQKLDGSNISSTSFAGSKTLLVFFRANWCPFCMNQLKEVLAKADRLKASGTQIKFISNQGFDNSTKLAAKLNLPAHYEILQDEELRAAKTLGIEDIGGSPVGMSDYPADTVMATVIALDADGNVLFGDETDNYRVRPHPNTFLNVFEQ